MNKKEMIAKLKTLGITIDVGKDSYTVVADDKPDTQKVLGWGETLDVALLDWILQAHDRVSDSQDMIALIEDHIEEIVKEPAKRQEAKARTDERLTAINTLDNIQEKQSTRLVLLNLKGVHWLWFAVLSTYLCEGMGLSEEEALQYVFSVGLKEISQKYVTQKMSLLKAIEELKDTQEN